MCDICRYEASDMENTVYCRNCAILVHKKCYGIYDNYSKNWLCDLCEENLLFY